MKLTKRQKEILMYVSNGFIVNQKWISGNKVISRWVILDRQFNYSGFQPLEERSVFSLFDKCLLERRRITEKLIHKYRNMEGNLPMEIFDLFCLSTEGKEISEIENLKKWLKVEQDLERQLLLDLLSCRDKISKFKRSLNRD
jgi:hypothetical protein